jgi:lipopolysaccharide export system protein LptC
VAKARLARLRVVLALAAVAVLGWFAYQTMYAGSDIPSQTSTQQTRISVGSANGKRLDGKSWSLDYSAASISPDGSIANIDDVHDGTIMRAGKPYMRMTAKHVTANLSASDFVVNGPVTFTEIGGQHRELETTGAHYSGLDHILHLDRPTTIRQGSVTLHVTTAVVNFQTGDTTLGRIVGTM